MDLKPKLLSISPIFNNGSTVAMSHPLTSGMDCWFNHFHLVLAFCLGWKMNNNNKYLELDKNNLY